MSALPATTLRIALPKGRMADGVSRLLDEAGISLRKTARGYRPVLGLADTEVKLLKPQNVVEMLASGSRDVGFAGADWVEELEVSAGAWSSRGVVEVLDTGLDPVRVVAAAPRELLRDGELPRRPLVIASEYERLTTRWIAERQLEARFVRSFGATEVFPPEDADCIVDNTATGATLAANGLEIVDELLRSSTRLYASRAAWSDPDRRGRIEDLALLLRSVIDARKRVMVEVNVSAAGLDELVAVLPCMREPTIARLLGDGFAVKVAVPRDALATLIPTIRARGGTDIVVSPISQLVP